MRLYQPIWQRIRANPGVRVPIECPSSYLQRVVLAVKKERAADKLYNRVSRSRGKQGIVYKSTAPHAEKQGMAVVSFILIEYAAVDYSDLKYLVRFPPPLDLMERIGVKELEAEYYASLKSDPYADFNYEAAAVSRIKELAVNEQQEKENEHASIDRLSRERNGQSNFVSCSLDDLLKRN